jgi:pimeloyl-ACP methyl ester carboxylesterase
VIPKLASFVLVLCLSVQIQAQERVELWFESQNYLSRQVALSDTSLSERQAENAYEDRVYQLHGELVLPAGGEADLSAKQSVEQSDADHKSTGMPAIVFLVGSGPNSSHRGLYAEFVHENLENLFLEKGIALFYFDKRGVGLSEGRWQRTDLFERADDARSAVRRLRDYPGIDGHRIGVVGHSQGGTVAQLLGALYGDSLAFVASLAAPTYDTERRLTHEYYSRFLCEGDPDAEAFDRAQKKAISDLNWVQAFPLTKAWRQLNVLSEFDPAPYLADITPPAYFAFAERDYFVSARWGLETLEQAFALANSEGLPAHITVENFAGLDHDFRPTENVCSGSGVGGEPSETPALPDYSEDFQRAFRDWVLQTLGMN